MRCFAQDALDCIEVSARCLPAAVENGNRRQSLLAALRPSTKRETVDTVAMRRQIADVAVDTECYPLS